MKKTWQNSINVSIFFGKGQAFLWAGIFMRSFYAFKNVEAQSRPSPDRAVTLPAMVVYDSPGSAIRGTLYQYRRSRRRKSYL